MESASLIKVAMQIARHAWQKAMSNVPARLDHVLIANLRTDGRVSLSRLAKTLNVSHGRCSLDRFVAAGACFGDDAFKTELCQRASG